MPLPNFQPMPLDRAREPFSHPELDFRDQVGWIQVAGARTHTNRCKS